MMMDPELESDETTEEQVKQRGKKHLRKDEEGHGMSAEQNMAAKAKADARVGCRASNEVDHGWKTRPWMKRRGTG